MVRLVVDVVVVSRVVVVSSVVVIFVVVREVVACFVAGLVVVDSASVVLIVVAVVVDAVANPVVVTGLALGAAVVVFTEGVGSLSPTRFGKNDGRERDRFRILPRRPSTFSTSFFSRFTGVAWVVETPTVVAFGRIRDARFRNRSLRRCAAAESRRRAAGELVVVVLGEDAVAGARGVVVRCIPGGRRRGFSDATRTPGLLDETSEVELGVRLKLEADDLILGSTLRPVFGFSIVVELNDFV